MHVSVAIGASFGSDQSIQFVVTTVNSVINSGHLSTFMSHCRIFDLVETVIFSSRLKQFHPQNDNMESQLEITRGTRGYFDPFKNMYKYIDIGIAYYIPYSSSSSCHYIFV